MLRSAMTMADFWYHCLETMAQTAYQTRKACEFFLENGGVSEGRHGPFAYPMPPSAAAPSNGSVDMSKLKDSLKSMDPMQAAQVLHAVQMMEAMELMQRQRSRPDESGPGW